MIPRNSYAIRLTDDLVYLHGCFRDQLNPNERDVEYGFCL